VTQDTRRKIKERELEERREKKERYVSG